MFITILIIFIYYIAQQLFHPTSPPCTTVSLCFHRTSSPCIMSLSYFITPVHPASCLSVISLHQSTLHHVSQLFHYTSPPCIICLSVISLHQSTLQHVYQLFHYTSPPCIMSISVFITPVHPAHRVSVFSNKQTNNNDLLLKDGGTKNCGTKMSVQGLIVWHSRSRRCALTAIKSLHYKLD